MKKIFLSSKLRMILILLSLLIIFSVSLISCSTDEPKCNAHADLNCDGKCDACAGDALIAHQNLDGDNMCDRCGEQIISASKSASVTQGITLYPATHIEYNEATLRGARVTYKISVSNTSSDSQTVFVSDIVQIGRAHV